MLCSSGRWAEPLEMRELWRSAASAFTAGANKAPIILDIDTVCGIMCLNAMFEGKRVSGI